MHESSHLFVTTSYNLCQNYLYMCVVVAICHRFKVKNICGAVASGRDFEAEIGDRRRGVVTKNHEWQ